MAKEFLDITNNSRYSHIALYNSRCFWTSSAIILITIEISRLFAGKYPENNRLQLYSREFITLKGIYFALRNLTNCSKLIPNFIRETTRGHSDKKIYAIGTAKKQMLQNVTFY